MKSINVVLLLIAAMIVLGNCDASGQYAWTKSPSAAFTGSTESWNKEVWAPSILFNPDSSRYEMWFSTGPGSETNYQPFQVGFAVSQDAISWKRVGSSPVLAPVPGTWQANVCNVSVLREGGIYKMWYSATRSTGGSDSAFVAYATSSDGITWTRYANNPVLRAGPAAWEGNTVGDQCVIHTGGLYQMWYDAGPSNASIGRIGRATSPDGIHWTKDSVHNPVVDMGGVGQWDQGALAFPRVFSIKDTMFMLYTCIPSNLVRRVGLARSTDGGTVWQKYGTGPILSPGASGSWDQTFVQEGFVLPFGNTLRMWYSGYSSGTALTNIGMATSPLVGGQFWQLQNSSLPADVGGIGFFPVSNRVCWALGFKLDESSAYPGYIRTTDGGSTWVCDSIPGAESGVQSSMAAIDADTAYVAVFVNYVSSSKGIYKTTDGGATWTKQNAYSSSLYGPGYIHFFDANNGFTVGDPNLEAYTTTNGGRNWNPVGIAAYSNEYTWTGGPGMAGHGNRLWFSTGGRIFRSTDKGYTWSATTAESGFFDWHPCVAFQDSNTGIYALRKRGDIPHLYRKTTDGGVTWATLSNPVLDSLAPTCIIHMPGTKATYVVAGGMPQGMRGLACTYDAGNSWTLLDRTGVFDVGFASPYVGWADDYSSNAVFKYVGFPLSISVKDGIVAPASCILAQNYPNPFNPSTTIRFELPKALHVSLIVYDIIGREVSVLVNDRMPAGVHDVKFNATNLASGVYFYRLQAGDFVQTKKLLILR